MNKKFQAKNPAIILWYSNVDDTWHQVITEAAKRKFDKALRTGYSFKKEGKTGQIWEDA